MILMWLSATHTYIILGDYMLGAIIGDIVGSRFEWHSTKSKDFELFNYKCRPTDDSIMTEAVALSLLDCDGECKKLYENTVLNMQALGRSYPDAGYGSGFSRWIYSDNPQPYNSFGNGSAMRVSPCSFAASSLDEALLFAETTAAVTHNHPEGIKGAKATAAAIYLARTGKKIDEIRNYIDENYYPMSFTLSDIRPTYKFDVTCQGSVPQALMCFFESSDFEDTIRNAVSLGGDSDTQAAIAGGIAEAYYGIPETIKQKSLEFLDKKQILILNKFEERY